MLLEKSLEERLSLAIHSSDTKILTQLMNSPSTKIRRAVARNRNTPRGVLDILAFDPVLNVSYKAVKNPNCGVDRCLNDVDHPCVCCTLAEDVKSCINCKVEAS